MSITFLRIEEHPVMKGESTVTKNILFETRDSHAWIHCYKNPGDKDDLHCHNADQTVLILKGECTMGLVDGSRKLTPGDFAMIPKGEFYQLQNSGNGPMVLLATRGAPPHTSHVNYDTGVDARKKQSNA
jgi:mannose-6-phosphate isomerase-like protein (cupin superfamily)